MDLAEFPDFDINHLLDATTALDDGFLAPFRQISMPKVNARTKEKRSRLAERIAQGDELIRQVKQLQVQNKQLADLQRTAQEVTDLYQKEKQQRLELHKQSQQLGERCAELEQQLDVQVIQCENLQEELDTRTLPVDAKEVLGILLQLEQRLGDDAGLVRRDQNILKKLKDYCKTANIGLPTPKSPKEPRNKRRSQATQTEAEPVPEKPTACSVALQVENLTQTRDQGTQHKNTTTTRGTTTASFIKKHDVGTSFPEPKPLPNVRQILDEMLSWRDAPLRPLSPLCDLLPEMEEMPATVSVATCTTLCNIHREIDFLSEVPPQIKVSASRPPSRAMFDSVKEEARSSRELARELLHFLPQNQSCLANLPPQAFEELWQVFGQMVLGLLQRRPSPSTVSQADFTRWLYELYEGTQSQPEESSGKGPCQKDFSDSTECMDVGTDPIVASPNISHGGDITPIRLPPKPKARRHKSKKRKAAASLIRPIAKRTCQESLEPAEITISEHEQAPETAIQFLSTLNTFNMRNCDNLDLELDEEEMYLLQLTSKAAMQEEQEQPKETACGSPFLPLPEVQKKSESSLNDDRKLESTQVTENPENSDGITCKETEEELGEPGYLPSLPQEEAVPSENEPREEESISSLPDLCQEQTNPLESHLSSSVMELDQSTEKAIITNLTEVPPTPPDTPFNGNESNLCEEQLPNDDIDSDLNSCKEQEHHAATPKTPEEADKYFYSSDSDSEDNNLQGTILKSNLCKSPKSKGDSISYLFGNDSDVESEASEEQLPKDTELDPIESEEEVNESQAESGKQLIKEETKWSPIEPEEGFAGTEEETELDTMDSAEPLIESESESSKQQLLKEEFNCSPIALETELFSEKETEFQPIESEEEINEPPVESNTSDLPLVVGFKPNVSQPDLEKNEKLLYTLLSNPSVSFCDDFEDSPKLIIDVDKSPSKTPEDSLPSATSKRRRTVSEFKSPPTPGEGRLTRQKAKQLLLEQNSGTESRTPFEANKSEPPKTICNPAPAPVMSVEPDQSYSCHEESPASPCSEPVEELVDSIPEIPLERPECLQYDGQPKSIIQHVIDQCKVDPKLSQLRRKTLGKSQPKLCASIGKYLEESLELEDLCLDVYKLTKEEAVIVNAMVVVATKIDLEENPLERLLAALKYFNYTQRFLAELEERLFRNTKERPPTELAMKYVKLYLAAVSRTASDANPARLLLAKLLYHYENDMPETVLAVLRQFPTVLPHREERQYDHSDPLITVIKHLLMSRTYDMQDTDGAERMLLSKLRFEYHYQPFEPSKQQVLENLVEKLKAGRSLEQLGYAFALFCRRSPHIKAVDLVVTEHLMPLATSYCDLAAGQDEAYDDRLVGVLQCISVVLKPLSLDTDISAFVGLVKRLFVAVPRPLVQQAAVQACLRLQRFGFQAVREALQNYRPNYPLDPLTRAMLRCFAERRNQYHILAPKGGTRK